MLRKFFLPAILLTIVFPTLRLLSSADGNKVESIGAFSDPNASDSLKNGLETKGYRVILADGNPLCDIWFRTAVPVREKKDLPAVTYPELADSTLLAVVSFPKPAKDFRGQTIKAGAYAARYALHPEDGNHLGISINRDFLLLVPVGIDKDINAQFKFEDLAKLSKNASGTNHPAPMSLVPLEKRGDFPSLVENDRGHLILQVKLKTQSGNELPIALVVKGVAEG
ncbi:MAG TPA: hypothetical protein VGQ81_03115 [Acidobacteriota bacterium]|nr:hypothetical protein [Acidobacteriota bacterium]